MAMPPLGTDWAGIRGEFKHRETGKFFAFRDAGERDMALIESPHQVFVGPDSETRYARVLKTVAYVVVDENDEGLVIEKWPVRELWRRTHDELPAGTH